VSLNKLQIKHTEKIHGVKDRKKERKKEGMKEGRRKGRKEGINIEKEGMKLIMCRSIVQSHIGLGIMNICLIYHLDNK
jgi:predicted transposase YdaD